MKGSQEELLIPEARVLDTKGLVCPYPAVRTKKALEELPQGEVLEVWTDNRTSALESIPTICERQGCEFLVIEEGPELWRIRIRRKG